MRHRKERTTLAVCAVSVIAVGATLFASLPAQAGDKSAKNKTYAVQDCQFPRVRPHRIIFTCADGGAYINNLRWTRWGRHRAGGHGVFHLNDCTPDCAQGHFHDYGAKIGLRKPRKGRCNGHVVRLFHVARLHFPQDNPPNEGFWHKNRMFCAPD